MYFSPPFMHAKVVAFNTFWELHVEWQKIILNIDSKGKIVDVKLEKDAY